MMNTTDFINDETGDLGVQDGDFILADATTEHKLTLLRLRPGQWRPDARLGVDSSSWLLDNFTNTDAMASAIAEAWQMDGISYNQITVSKDGRIEEDGYYA